MSVKILPGNPTKFFFYNVKQSFLHQIVYYLLKLIQREYTYVKLSTCFTGTEQECAAPVR